MKSYAKEEIVLCVCGASFSAVDDINRLKRWGQAAVAVTRVDLAIGSLGVPHPGRLITHREVRERRFNMPSSDLFPTYTN